MLSILFNLPVPVAALFVDFKNLNLHDNLSKHHKSSFVQEKHQQMHLPALTLPALSNN